MSGAARKHRGSRKRMDEAKEFFGNVALHASTRGFGEDNDDSNQAQYRVRQVLDSLGPTDDPESLGRIGGYEVTGVVGAGGMGVVLKAHDRSLDRIVAIKVMAPHLASSGSARKRFAREAKAAAAVLHPNVIAIHSVASEDANPYLVMPFRARCFVTETHRLARTIAAERCTQDRSADRGWPGCSA